MSASDLMLIAFRAWASAEQAIFTAEDCEDEAMDRLTARSADAFHELAGVRAENADDMLLKLFPVLLQEFPPAKGEPPMRLSYDLWYGYDPAFFDTFNIELGRRSPSLLEVISVDGRTSAGGDA